MASLSFVMLLLLPAVVLVDQASSKVIGHRNRRQDGGLTVPPVASVEAIEEPTTAAPPPVSQEECEMGATEWSPWTGKWENIKARECGRRRRTRRVTNNTLAELCYEANFELIEFQEFCEVNTRNETTEIFQFYFVDEVFGYSSQVAEVEETRRGRRSLGLSLDHFLNWPAESTCPDDVRRRPVDFLIMLDKSGSMKKKQFNNYLVKSMAFLIKRGIPSVSNTSTRVAMITFANRPTIEFHFNECSNKVCLQKAMRRTNFTGGHTRVAHALEEAEVVFQEKNGMRECSRRVVLMLTDGLGNIEHVQPDVAARNLRVGKGVEIFVVGVTSLINEAQLQEIASPPSLTHLYYMPSMRTLRKVCKNLKVARARE